MSDRAVRRAIVLCFFASGAAGLVYQVLWTRQLSLIFGVTTYAVATVLATFMGGLALGSFFLGRMVDRRPNALAWYALLELGIGLYALLVTPLFRALAVPYVALHRLDASYTTLAAMRALLAALVLLPPTTLMGGTFPALTRYWVRASAEIGRGAGLLYFVNTSGAIVGCVLAGFLMLEHLGLRGTTITAALLNVAVALLALALSRLERRTASPAASPSDDAQSGGLSRSGVTLALLCVGMSGFVSLAHEVLWSRALLRYLYNSTYAFTTMLATFLLGIAVGSAVYARWLHRVRRPLLLLGVLQMLVGLGFLVSSVVFPHLPGITDALAGGTRIGSFTQSLWIMVLNASLTLLFPTIVLGASFPLATSLAAQRLASIGSAVGVVYAINTLGAILGSLGTGFVLIPAIGMRGTLTLLIVLSIVGGSTLALAAVRRAAARVTTITCTVLLLAATLWSAREDVFRLTFAPPGRRLVYYQEGATDSVAVAEHFGQRVIMYEDQRGTAGTNSFRTNYFFGHLPVLLHPGRPRRVLHICFGVGNSLSAVAAHDDVEHIDSVELSPHVVGAAPYFWTNSGVITHPKVRTIIDDGRNYVMATNETYDIIALEPPETFTAGVINLYTPEFYRDALERLAPDGIMMQWIPTGASPIEQERMLFRAFSDVFPHVTAWQQLDSGCMLLIGTRSPLTIDYLRLRRRMDQPLVRRDMELSGVRDADHLLSFFVFDERGFAEFVRDASPVTDDRTVLDFTIPRYLGSGFGLGSWNIRAQHDGRNPFGEAMIRMNFYGQRRRPVVPLLTNLGGEAPQAIAQRIAASATIPIPNDWVPESKFRRW
jgi:spermidine synthase